MNNLDQCLIPDILWVCLACGRMSESKEGNDPTSDNWDKNCSANAVRVYSDLITVEGGRVVRIEDEGYVRDRPLQID